MSLKLQKIIMFIPVVSIVTTFCWMKLYSKEGVYPHGAFKQIMKMFLGIFIVAVARLVVIFAFENETLNTVVMYVSIWLYFLVIGFVSVRAQEKILKNTTVNNEHN